MWGTSVPTSMQAALTMTLGVAATPLPSTSPAPMMVVFGVTARELQLLLSVTGVASPGGIGFVHISLQ